MRKPTDGDDQNHHKGKWIEVKADRRIEGANRYPSPQNECVGIAIRRGQHEADADDGGDDRREGERTRHR